MQLCPVVIQSERMVLASVLKVVDSESALKMVAVDSESVLTMVAVDS